MLSLGITRFLLDSVLPEIPNKDSVVCLSRSGIIGCDADKITQDMLRRGLKVTEGPYTGREFLLDAGFKNYDDIDFVPDEGVSIVHNMNEPLPADTKQYDLVLECGTMEHIFDVAQVFKNMIRLCKVGGTVCHISPLTWLNHGFYNFSLTLFYDVYRTNYFENEKFWLMNWPRNYLQVGSSNALKVDFIPSQILQPANTEFLMLAYTAKKTVEGLFRIPTQAAYDPELKLNTPLRTHQVINE